MASAADEAKILDAKFRLGGIECLQAEPLPDGFVWGTPGDPNYDQFSHVYSTGISWVRENGEDWHEYKSLCECYTTVCRPENKPGLELSSTLRPDAPNRTNKACESCLRVLCRE